MTTLFRSCGTWQPTTDNLRQAFRSLAHHLLTNYRVPGFMDSVWEPPAGPEAFRQQTWFIRLGRGASFRDLALPIPLTRSMEHFVRQAPDHYTTSEALRHGESRGLGCDEKLTRQIVNSRLGRDLEHAEFWRTVLLFFMTHPETKLEHVNPIIDFIYANKFAIEEVGTENGTELRSATWPDFSIKGRTLKSIMRLVSDWHSDLSSSQPCRSFSWAKSGIRGYRYLEKRAGAEHDFDWTIMELLNSAALLGEGRTMRHCVYSYANRCREGETSIWSLRLRIDGREKRMVTIEVDPRRRTIIQARAKCNLRPGGRSQEIIRRWAECAGLRFDLAV